MNVSAEPYVIRQVPANMIGIVIDYDVVAVPQPVAAIADIDRRNAEVESAKPEATGTAAGQPPRMTLTDAAGKVPVLEGMIQVVARIVGAAIVADPFVAFRVYVWRFGMALLIGKSGMFGWSRGIGFGSASRRWTV